MRYSRTVRLTALAHRLIRPLSMAVVLMAPAGRALAHPPLATAALVNIERGNDGQAVMTVTVFHDALAFALNDTSTAVGDPAMYALLEGPEADLTAALQDGRERFAIGFHIWADGKPIETRLVKSPDLAGIHQWLNEHTKAGGGRPTLPCKMDFLTEATLPADAQTFTLQLPEILGDTILIVHRPGFEPLSMPLRAAEISPETEIGLGRGAATTSSDSTSPHQPRSHDVGVWGVIGRFIRLGFTHIIPGGPDHCLFVLGLFLLSPRLKPVLWQISSFTVAHTVTLTLTSLHIIGLPSSIVEPTIAASIAFIAIENLMTKKVHSWRPAVAFVFGLVHGMGVATAFNEAGFPPGQLVQSLAAFTVGVEGGHIAVLLAAFAALGWSKDKKWYRSRLAIPLSLIIAAIALYWMAQRIIGF